MIETLPIVPSNRLVVTLRGQVTCLCPVNGRRDYAAVEVSYAPTECVLELSGFGAYLSTFADRVIAHEELTRLIQEQLAEQFGHDEVTVRTEWAPVEGVGCVVVAS